MSSTVNLANSASILDQTDRFAKLDSAQLLPSIQSLADQCQEAWEETQKLVFKPSAPITQIVVSGLGGSAFGADLALSTFKDELALPIEVSRDYDLPGYINENTLVILASYSGSTEETLACLDQIQARRTQVMAIATGGPIIEFAQQFSCPYYQIQPHHNPSGQPRTALGYSIVGSLGLLKLAGALPELNHDRIKNLILSILSQDEKYQPDLPTEQNAAKLLALQLVDHRPTLIGADFLAGALHVGANTLNENSKYLADFKVVPDMNHHWLEGLNYPASNNHDQLMVIFRSDLNLTRNQARLNLNQELFDQLEFPNLNIQLEQENKLNQSFEVINLLNYTSFYLAMLMGIDPGTTPHVKWLKEQLSNL